MKRATPLAMALSMGIAMPAQAGAPRLFTEGTPVVIVGVVSSQPRDIGVATEQKMQVAVGRERIDYTLHLKDARLYGYHGQPIKADHFRDRMWVRAEGRLMDDPRRIRVAELEVVGMDLPDLRRTAYYRRGDEHGYITAVAGSRETYPAASLRDAPAPVVIVGKISDDTGPLEHTRKLRIRSAGEEWTLDVPRDTSVYDDRGELISVHEISEGQWVRATGWQTGNRRLQVSRMENLGRDELFRRSRFYRENARRGYLERTAGAREELRPVTVRGTITAIYPERGFFMVRDETGREVRIDSYTAEIMFRGRETQLRDLRVGDTVAVDGHVFEFEERR
jgi:hypothetical protein